MISVLIPVYNFDVNSLVGLVHNQLSSCAIPFEILVMDDKSDTEFTISNSKINELHHTRYLVSETNHGRLKTRVLLSEEAQYEWLLFMDADTLPKSERFIENYLDAINDNTETIFGGFAYYDKAPENKHLLRWKYGKKHEVSDASDRNKKPYKLIISANFMIKKTVLKNLDLKFSVAQYGYDSYFGSRLKSEGIQVNHINNEVYHLGLEENWKYLEKKEQAAESLLHFYKNNLIQDHQNSLLSLFVFLKKLQLHHLFAACYKSFGERMRSNLTGNNPSIALLQLYRISYLCNSYKNGKD
ncbi:MAG: glycosyltransferase [Bacteroidia bacterium]|nr:glycosyltransferase [Bacteroidia bacterium]